MNITNIFILISTIVFTFLGFTYPVGGPFYWGYRGVVIILAIIGWLLVYSLYFR